MKQKNIIAHVHRYVCENKYIHRSIYALTCRYPSPHIYPYTYSHTGYIATMAKGAEENLMCPIFRDKKYEYLLKKKEKRSFVSGENKKLFRLGLNDPIEQFTSLASNTIFHNFSQMFNSPFSSFIGCYMYIQRISVCKFVGWLWMSEALVNIWPKCSGIILFFIWYINIATK